MPSFARDEGASVCDRQSCSWAWSYRMLSSCVAGHVLGMDDASCLVGQFLHWSWPYRERSSTRTD
jgi:hypothetical protein